MSRFEKEWEELLELAAHLDRQAQASLGDYADSVPLATILIEKARSLGTQEALQRVEGEVIGQDEAGFATAKERQIIRNNLREEHRTKLAKLREEYGVK